ncbi:hypothetical protein DFH07DRAFT_967698 [Mycena maculata]|uniref:Uncharacterized protein n=1 Tax=Mycena maculata TaxID=230809 RepID=A0AAD7I4W8_9AGAR|nr:hypothetical protein DFH07DRAFT_967698 [Mycena maculata]
MGGNIPVAYAHEWVMFLQHSLGSFRIQRCSTSYAGVGVTLGLQTLAANPLLGPLTIAIALYPIVDILAGVGKLVMVVERIKEAPLVKFFEWDV